MTHYILGIDPDTKNTGLAIVKFEKNSKPVVVWAGVAAVKGGSAAMRREPMADALLRVVHEIPMAFDPVLAVVEWQQLRPRGEKNPNSIVDLCGIAGMCVVACSVIGVGSILTPSPARWKGQVPKNIHHNRIRSQIIFDPDSGFHKLTKTRQGHVMDAIGLALWADNQRRLATS